MRMESAIQLQCGGPGSGRRSSRQKDFEDHQKNLTDRGKQIMEGPSNFHSMLKRKEAESLSEHRSLKSANRRADNIRTRISKMKDSENERISVVQDKSTGKYHVVNHGADVKF